jgi:hypothetical protein
MQSKPATVAAPFLFEADRAGATAGPAGVQAVDRFDGSPNIGRDAYRLSAHDSTVGKGSIVVALVWLAFYVIAMAYPLISEPAPLTSTAKPSAPMAAPSPR